MTGMSYWPAQSVQFPRCVWRERGNPNAPQCNGKVEAQHRSAVCCWQHSAAYSGATKEIKHRLKALAAKEFDGEVVK